MKRACFSVCMFGFLSLASPAIANFDTGNAVLEKCTSQNPFAEGVCIGLISGYFEGMQMSYTCSKVSPNMTTRKQVKDVVVKYLKDNPADRHLAGIALAYRAFYVAFDCKPKPNTN